MTTDAKPYTKEDQPSVPETVSLDRVRATVAAHDEALEVLAEIVKHWADDPPPYDDQWTMDDAVDRARAVLARGGR